MTTYNELIEKVIAILKSSNSIKNRYKDTIERMEERRSSSEHNTYRMGVIGVTSSGKSTIINTLLKEDLLPYAVKPSSSQLVSCRWGSSRRAEIVFKNKQPLILSGNSLTQQVIAKYGAEENNPNNKENVNQIKIWSPDFPFDNELELVDSPGLDAYGLEGHEELTLNTLLPSVDFCLFITTCKVNSDAKTHSVLNKIAEYKKPVVIILNMIDSIKPSYNDDGSIRKAEAELIDEYRNRVQKVVDKSSIKSMVEIIPYSAVWARTAQKTPDDDLLTKSGYINLKNAIEQIYKQLKPQTESKRIQFLHEEVDKLIEDADKAWEGHPINDEKFEFEDSISTIREQLSKKEGKINKSLSDLQKFAKNLEEEPILFEFEIEGTQIQAKKECDSCANSISECQKSINKEIKELCDKLGIEVKEIFNSSLQLPKFSCPKAKYRKVKKRTKKKGPINWLKRINPFSNEDAGYEITYENEVDTERTKESIIEYVNTTAGGYSRAFSLWHEKVENAIAKLESHVGNRRAEYEARKSIILENREYRAVSDELKKLRDAFPEISMPQISDLDVNSSKIESEKMFSAEIPVLSYKIYQLAFKKKGEIHRFVFDKYIPQIGNPDNIVFGWDSNCLKNFADIYCGSNLNLEGEPIISRNIRFRFFYNQERIDGFCHTKSPCNCFVLISALQQGQALKRLAQCGLYEYIRESDNLYIVVQDFMEIINAENGIESLTELKAALSNEKSLKTSPIILPLHNNPVFSAVALITQYITRTGHSIEHKDEITIAAKFQNNKVFRLLCKSPGDKNVISKIIKSLK